MGLITNLPALLALLTFTTVVSGTGQIAITSRMRGLVSGRFDPIVAPGKISQHAHHILGGNYFGAAYDPTRLRQSQCSQLHSQADKSNYWHPMIYKVIVNETLGGKWQYSPMKARTRVYYNFPQLAPNATLEPFPYSFQMIAGDPSKKVGNRYLQEDMSVFFYCFRYDADGNDISYQTSKLPIDGGCANLVSKVFFPSCWNGKPYDPKNPHAHMQYPLMGGGLFGSKCPPGYPRRFPVILIETFHFGAGDFGPAPSYGGNGPDVPTYILANGDTTGFGLHGDFQNGWDMNVLTNVVNQCQNPPFADPAWKACPPLEDTWNEAKGDNCTLNKGTLVPNENIGWEGPLDALPGCNPPWGATGPKPTCPGYNETTRVPWARLVGVEQNETPSLADLAKAPLNLISQIMSVPIQRRDAEDIDVYGDVSNLGVYGYNDTVPLVKREALHSGRMHAKIRRALSDKMA